MKIKWKIISISTLLLHLHAAAAPIKRKEQRKDAFLLPLRKVIHLYLLKRSL